MWKEWKRTKGGKRSRPCQRCGSRSGFQPDNFRLKFLPQLHCGSLKLAGYQPALLYL
jgi:hypothetical protein